MGTTPRECILCKCRWLQKWLENIWVGNEFDTTFSRNGSTKDLNVPFTHTYIILNALVSASDWLLYGQIAFLLFYFFGSESDCCPIWLDPHPASSHSHWNILFKHPLIFDDPFGLLFVIRSSFGWIRIQIKRMIILTMNEKSTPQNPKGQINGVPDPKKRRDVGFPGKSWKIQIGFPGWWI